MRIVSNDTGFAEDHTKINPCFSTMANEANLRDVSTGWLVFGISNKTCAVTGMSYCPERDHLESLKHRLPGMQIHERHSGKSMRSKWTTRVLSCSKSQPPRVEYQSRGKGIITRVPAKASRLWVLQSRITFAPKRREATGAQKKTECIKTRAFDDQHYANLKLEYLSKFGSALRKNIDNLLREKLSDAPNDAQIMEQNWQYTQQVLNR